MTVTVTNADFIHPIGELQATMFPKETLTDLLDTWITQATAKVAGVAAAEQDAAVSFWIYYRAYSAIAKRIGASPSSTSFGGNSSGGVESTINWGQNKAEYWEKLAQKALDDFQYYVPLVPPVDKGWTFKVY